MRDRGNKKLLWYILFALIAVVFCYLFIVVFFYYVSPYNISLKLTLWPFSSSKQVGKLYDDAIVNVHVTYYEEGTFDELQHADITGVNVRKEGVIVVPYSQIKKCDDVQSILVMHTSSGGQYTGELIYSNEEYNLSIIKCKNANGSKKAIKIPFVKEYSAGVSADDRVIVASSGLTKRSVWVGKVAEENVPYVVEAVDDENQHYVDHTIEDGYTIKLDYGGYSFIDGGIIFDRYAHLLGFSYDDTLKVLQEQSNTFYVQGASSLPYFLSDVLKSYKAGQEYSNEFVQKFVGFDSIEASRMSAEENVKTEGLKDYFYFKNAWREIDEKLDQYFSIPQPGFYLYEKFSYDEMTIGAGAIITSINFVGGLKWNVECRKDLFDFLYLCEKGDRLAINYKVFDGSEYTAGSLLVVV